MEFLSYFGGVFEPLSFLLLLGGTIGGLILGATPGLSPTMAVALLIPFYPGWWAFARGVAFG